MKFQQFGNTYVVRLERGERVIETLTLFLKEEGITFSTLIATGALSAATLGYYDLQKKEYIYLAIDEDVEVASMTGNTAMRGQAPLIHAHAVLSKRDFQTVGGHVHEATVAATLEVVFRAEEARVDRALDADIGLPLMQL